MSYPYQPHEEMSPEDALRAVLAKLPSDLTLKSTIDGTEIQVQRAMVAARSPVFDSMLYGPLAEASKSVITADYCGEVLDSLVKYIYFTGDIPLLSADIGAVVTTVGETDYEKLQQLITKIVSLIAASDYYALPGLSKKAIDYAIDEILRPVPTTTILWLAQCEVHAVLTDSSLEKAALEAICKDPHMLLDEKVEPIVGMLSSSIIESILQDCDRNAISHKSSDDGPTPDSIAFNDSTIFNIIKVWADNNEDNEGKQNRAKELTGKFITVYELDTKTLSSIDEKSSWMVSEDQILQAHIVQAQEVRVTQMILKYAENWDVADLSGGRFYSAIYAMYEGGNLNTNLIPTMPLQMFRFSQIRTLSMFLNAPWGAVEKLKKEAEVVVLSRLHSDDKTVVAEAEKGLAVFLKFWIQMCAEDKAGANVSRYVSALRDNPDQFARHFLVPVKIVGEVRSELISMLLQEG